MKKQIVHSYRPTEQERGDEQDETPLTILANRVVVA
jgi:hypothetical protein